MKHDLHWYVSEGNRKKGFLTKNLIETILPYILSARKAQKITIKIDEIGEDNYINSSQVAMNCGFQKLSDFEFIINENNQLSNQYFEIAGKQIRNIISEERMYEMRKKFYYMSKYILKIQN